MDTKRISVKKKPKKEENGDDNNAIDNDHNGVWVRKTDKRKRKDAWRARVQQTEWRDFGFAFIPLVKSNQWISVRWAKGDKKNVVSASHSPVYRIAYTYVRWVRSNGFLVYTFFSFFFVVEFFACQFFFVCNYWSANISSSKEFDFEWMAVGSERRTDMRWKKKSTKQKEWHTRMVWHLRMAAAIAAAAAVHRVHLVLALFFFISALVDLMQQIFLKTKIECSTQYAIKWWMVCVRGGIEEDAWGVGSVSSVPVQCTWYVIRCTYTKTQIFSSFCAPSTVFVQYFNCTRVIVDGGSIWLLFLFSLPLFKFTCQSTVKRFANVLCWIGISAQKLKKKRKLYGINALRTLRSTYKTFMAAIFFSPHMTWKRFAAN